MWREHVVAAILREAILTRLPHYAPGQLDW